MRNLFFAALLGTFAIAASGQVSPRISLLANGNLSGSTYSNDAVGVTYEIPAEWAATSDPKGAPALDPKPDVRANRCTKVLLWMKAPGGVEGRFNSIAALLAIDPQCISGPEFPQAVTDTDKIIKVADKIIKYYKNAPFFSPYGVKILATRTPEEPQGRVTILLLGGAIVNAIEGRRAATKEPLKVNTSFAVAESKGYWVAWAYLADDPSAELLKKVSVRFTNGVSR